MTTNDSYDEVLQATAANKMINIIEAYTSKVVGEEKIPAFRQRPGNTPVSADEARAKLIDDSCAEDYRVMFGQRCRREKWGNIQAPTEKDEFPEEGE